MREVKFLAWDEVEKKLVGPFAVGSEDSMLFPPEFQFTGQRDAAGKEIYEGHILAPPADPEGEGPYIVDFCENAVCFRLNFKQRISKQGFFWTAPPEALIWSKCKIIGHIKTNPELLK